VEYYSNGKLKTCTLARGDTLSGQPLAEGTVVTFTTDGVLDWCFLQKDAEIQGHLCKGQGHGWMTCFYPSGKLKLAWLGRDEIIQGIPCAEYSFWADAFGGGAGTYFHENGNLKRCKLARDLAIGGRALKKGTWAAFDEKGNYLGE
jgi:antitoxin component YwqK of YwqJK toxin-antitoxin module